MAKRTPQAGHASHRKSNSYPQACSPTASCAPREYLTEAEVERLMNAARKNRWGHRDATMVLRGLPARPAGVRTGGPALGSDRVQHRARLHVRRVKQGTPKHPSDPRGRVAGAAAAPARAGARVALRVHVGARSALQHRRVCPHGRAGRVEAKLAFKAHPHMLQARLRLCARQQGARHAGLAGLPRPPQHPAHREIYRTITNTVQGRE